MPDRKHGSAQPTPAHFRQPGCLPGFRSHPDAEERRQATKRLAELEVQGPRRKAPVLYAGETYSRHAVQYPDVARYPNGALPSIKCKPMRRIIRGALKRRFSSLTKTLRLAQGMRAQAYELASEEKRSGRWARRLLAKELAIHQPVYAPTKPELRAMRTKIRAAKRKGTHVDAISALADQMSKKP